MFSKQMGESEKLSTRIFLPGPVHIQELNRCDYSRCPTYELVQITVLYKDTSRPLPLIPKHRDSDSPPRPLEASI